MHSPILNRGDKNWANTHDLRSFKGRKSGQSVLSLMFERLEARLCLASQTYNWQNAPIRGGGFVTGIIYSPIVPNLVYARTDVGVRFAGIRTPAAGFR